MKKSISFILLALFISLGLIACSSPAKETTKKETIIVATDSDTAPFTYKEGDVFKGYDIEVLQAIFENSKDYELEFQTVDFPSILLGIDAGRFHIAANDFNYNEERAGKYLFSDPVSLSNYSIVSQEGKDFKSLDDLSGKKTEVIAGSNYAQLLENWNKEHPNQSPIDIQYVANSSGLSQRLQHIENGQIDFILYDAISSTYVSKDQGLKLRIQPLELQETAGKDGLEYFLFAKDKKGEELQAFVNQRLAELESSGRLKEISQTYFGGDFTVSSQK
ncbi:transporter substrate-binding domain-containing protein [Streptococcus himalayensis]|uniref:ABC transporter substrate-binding protein n=1 Tax=Streptococcus himalayensis TaxID=1888195 RepID=A0A917A6M2_9STRE|nr:transporter substrate-binding domain-containing protein [Streptococcus himalayensis]GGE30984.1 ABC transporter substrate-binding protein [Streptococcus himalayensis]